jgi:hypothetical protein
MIPYKEEFARVNIPVLNTAGYYYGGPGAAVYYFTEHLRYNPKTEHYLLIGPYDSSRRNAGQATRSDSTPSSSPATSEILSRS